MKTIELTELQIKLLLALLRNERKQHEGSKSLYSFDAVKAVDGIIKQLTK